MIGLSHLDQHKANRRPIAIDILKAYHRSVAQLIKQPCLQTSFWQLSMVTLQLGIRFRIGHAVQLQDITFRSDNKSLTINLDHSKTDQKGRGVVVNIKSADKYVCPVLSLRKFLKLYFVMSVVRQ